MTCIRIEERSRHSTWQYYSEDTRDICFRLYFSVTERSLFETIWRVRTVSILVALDTIEMYVILQALTRWPDRVLSWKMTTPLVPLGSPPIKNALFHDIIQMFLEWYKEISIHTVELVLSQLHLIDFTSPEPLSILNPIMADQRITVEVKKCCLPCYAFTRFMRWVGSSRIYPWGSYHNHRDHHYLGKSRA